MDKKNAIRFESVLNQSTVKVYTDGSKLNGRVGARFYAEYPNNFPKQAFFHLGIYSTVFQAEVLAISEVAKNLLLEKMLNQSIVVLVDSQAAIKALIKCTVTSITVLNCIRNLNQLGKQNHVSISWIPGHSGVHGNEVADYVAKSGSKSKIHGPKLFITVPYASCVNTVKDWSTVRWKSMWNKRKNCLRMKDRGGIEDTRLEAKDTTKKFEAKDSLPGDRHSRGQGQECSRPRPRTKDTSASALQKKKKKVFTNKDFSGDLQKGKRKKSSQKFFRRSPQKIVFQKNF